MTTTNTEPSQSALAVIAGFDTTTIIAQTEDDEMLEMDEEEGEFEDDDELDDEFDDEDEDEDWEDEFDEEFDDEESDDEE